MKKLLLMAVLCLCVSAWGQTANGGMVASTTDCTVVNSCVSLQFKNDSVGSASIQLTGTWVATISFEASSDGVTWVAIQGTPTNSPSPASSATANGTWRFSVGGLSNLRARCSAFTSGTANGLIRQGTVSAGMGGGAGFTSGGVTANTLPKSNGSSGLQDSLASDDATTLTYTGAGGVSAISYATTASNGGFVAVEGTGAGLTAVAGSDLMWADSTGHCFKVNLNNSAAGCLAAIDKAQTWSLGQTFSALVTFSNGTAANPSTGFASEATLGFYRNAAGVIGVAGLGGVTQTFNANSGYITAHQAGGFSIGSTNVASPDISLNRVGVGIFGVGTSGAGTAGTIDLATLHYRGLNQTYFVTSDFTTSGVGTALEAITGLTWTFPATTVMNVRVDCNLLYNQNVAAVAVAFGFKDATVAPTNLAASAIMYTNTTASTEGTLAASATTTATAIVSATPSAITTIWQAQLHLLIEQPSNASTSVFDIRVSTATAADTVTIKRGSYCSLTQ